MVEASGRDILVCVDGGITRDNIAEVAAAGADLIAAGSAMFDGKAAAANARASCSDAGGRQGGLMRSRWSEDEAAGFVACYGPEWGEPLALRTYSSRLLGGEPALVLHGGGNSSVKARWLNILGEDLTAVFVKASGTDMATIEPGGHPGLDLEYLRRLRALPDLDDQAMVDELRAHLLRADSPTPSIEALVHAFLPGIYIDHTHADAILALTNQDDGGAVVRRSAGRRRHRAAVHHARLQAGAGGGRGLEDPPRCLGHGVGASRHRDLGQHRPRFL